MAVDALLIDLDGTTWDSDPWYAELIRTVADSRPIAVQLRESGFTRSAFARTAAERAESLRLQPGVVEVLSDLQGAGIPLGAVTNLPSWLAIPMLAATDLDRFLTVTITYGDTRSHKPHPAPVLAALAGLGVRSTSDVWYVGDTKADAAAARRAGVSFAFAAYAATAPLGDETCELELVEGFEPLRELL